MRPPRPPITPVDGIAEAHAEERLVNGGRAKLGVAAAVAEQNHRPVRADDPRVVRIDDVDRVVVLLRG